VQLLLDAPAMGANFDWSNECADLRFYYCGSLDYWVENCSPGAQTASVWVRVPFNVTSAPQNISVYYGNASFTDAGNGDGTFEFFDSFEGSSIDAAKWNETTVNNLTYAVRGGNFEFLNASYTGTMVCSTQQSQLKSLWEPITNYNVRWKTRVAYDVSPPYNGFAGVGLIGSDGYPNGASEIASPDMQFFLLHDAEGACFTNFNAETANNTDYWYRAYVKGDYVMLYDNSNSERWWGTSGGVSELALIANYLEEQEYQNVTVDYIFASKYAQPEPSASMGSEAER
jgi:hypothetical protein